MGLLGAYLRFRILVVLAAAMAVSALAVVTTVGGVPGLFLLLTLVVVGFAVLTVLLAVR